MSHSVDWHKAYPYFLCWEKQKKSYFCAHSELTESNHIEKIPTDLIFNL